MISSYHYYQENNIHDCVLKLIQTSLPDKHGCLSLGVRVDIRYARTGFFFGWTAIRPDAGQRGY